MSLSTIDLVVFVVFIASVIGLGLYKSKGEGKDSESYFLAGRGLMWWLIGVSLIAANISSEQFVGMSGSAADYMGLAISSYEWMAAITLVVVAFAFLPYFLKSGIFTMPQFLQQRYGDGTRAIMAFMTMVLLVFVSLTGVIYAGGLTMSELFADHGFLDLGLTGWCWMIGMMAAIYIAAGGLNASAWADLIQGIALILGGAIITYFALQKLGMTPVSELTAGSAHPKEVADNASGIAKLIALNHEKMHMKLPSWDKNIPWTALILGLWIPNFYYWGLNQYITQRVLGSSSLKQGQKGIVFAAGMKLIIPFVIVIPGIIAFNLYSKELSEIDARKNAADWTALEQHVGRPESGRAFVANIQWARLNPEKAAAIDAHNIAVLKAKGGDASGLDAAALTEEQRFAIIPARLAKIEKSAGLTLHPIQGYKYDAALNLLMKNLLPENIGIRGFVIAALLGAIVSSLAAVLNAASTIFTMDIYQRYFSQNSSQKGLVAAGRIAVGVFAVIGCLLAPNLDKFGSIFKYIQQFQGYASPGILAVFVFGILNRRGPGICGVVGLLLNPLLYWALDQYTDLAFLDAMGVCFFSVLAVMWIIALVKPLAQPVVFETRTTMNVEGCASSKIAGGIVIACTLLLYVIFW
ncbi:MAG: sodium/solute symporter [Luteolibacter sp.]|jgi:SSS family solute:Na+ symporter|nr:sodium/solute symporter [Luteolibacter sp.]